MNDWLAGWLADLMGQKTGLSVPRFSFLLASFLGLLDGMARAWHGLGFFLVYMYDEAKTDGRANERNDIPFPFFFLGGFLKTLGFVPILLGGRPELFSVRT